MTTAPLDTQPTLAQPYARHCTPNASTFAFACGRAGGQEGAELKLYVRQAFRKYLECGIFAHGFAGAWCDGCGHDYFVAHSYKGRGVCPLGNTSALWRRPRT